MKTLYILFIGLLVSGGVMAQSCLPEGITFETQAQIDSFQINYPNCTEIEGQVTIGRELQTNDFTNLNGLNMLTSIGGNMLIQRAHDLTNLEGLNNVTSIGGSLSLIGNGSLNSLSALENLTSIDGDLVIGIYHNWGGNSSLISLSGLENVSFIAGGLQIAFNDSLTTCAIESICDYIANPSGTIEIHDNAIGCSSQQEVEEACDALPCFPDGITFSSQAQIDSFQINYPNCSEIEGDVEISGDDITNLNELNVLTSLGGWLYVMDNSLTSLTGLDNLTSIEGGLYIQGHDALTKLTGLEGLTSIGEEFAIFYNASLTSLTGLDNLTSIGAGLYIEGNASLTSLTGLENMTSIGEDFSIVYNASLTSLTGLNNLTSIGGGLGIEENASLTSLTGLDSIDAGSITNLYICYNESLSTCEVQSVCDYLASPNGTIEIHDNATGCNNQQEVEEACTAGLDDNTNSLNHLNIYPNPSSTQFTIELPLKPQKNTILSIYNLNGQQLIAQPITEPQTVVDVSGLPSGVYFVKVVDDGKVMMRKVVKE